MPRVRLFELLLFVLAALFALQFDFRLPGRLPDEGDYRQVAEVLSREAQEKDVVLLQPWWTERARLFLPEQVPVVGYLGDEADPLERYQRVWVLAQDGLPVARNGRFEERFSPDREKLSERRFGRLTLALYKNGHYRPTLFSATESWNQARVYLERPDGQRVDCPNDGVQFRCPGSEPVAAQWHEVLYKPERCLYVHPPGGDTKVVVEFALVPAGALRLQAGIIWEHAWFHGDGRTPLNAVAEVPAGPELARVEVPLGVEGYRAAEATLAAPTPIRAWVQSTNEHDRQSCLELEVLGPAAGAPDAMIDRARQDRWIGWGLFGLGLLCLAATQGPVGVPRDESFYFLAAQNAAGWLKLLFTHPSLAFEDGPITQAFSYNSEHPVLMKLSFALSYLVFHDGLGMSAQLAFRLPAFAAAASIPMLIFWMGNRLFGRTAGLFGAITFFLTPRQFFEAHLACFDVPIAAAVLLTVYCFWRAQHTRWGWLWTGVAFGLACATKHNGLLIPFVLAPLGLYRAWRLSEGKPEARSWLFGFVGLLVAVAGLYLFLIGLLASSSPSGRYGPLDGLVKMFEPISPPTLLFVLLAGGSAAILHRLHRADLPTFRAAAPIAAMAVLGPVLFYALWPYLWHHPVVRTADYLEFHATHIHYAWFYLDKVLREPPFPLEYVFAVTAMTVPTSLLVPMASGLVTFLARTATWFTGKGRALIAPATWDDALIGVNALAPILLISEPSVPHFGGVKHWFTAMPFLALIAGAAVSRAAEVAAPRLKAWRPTLPPWTAAVALSALLFLPALWGTARLFTFGTSYYAEIAGGLPGAASLGMQRQFWSNNVTGVLPWINQNAPPNARVWLHEVTDYSFMDYKREGALRADLQIAHGPGEAEIAAYQYHQEFREQEFDIWQAFGTTKPVTGLYLDETPQIVVYRRPVRRE